MKPEVKYFLIGVAIMFALAAIAGAIYAIVAHSRKKLVERTSRKLQLVEELAKQYAFYSIKNEYSLLIYCDNKSKFDRTRFVDYFLNYITEHKEHVDALIRCALENRKRLASFKEEYVAIVENDTMQDIAYYRKIRFFRDVERKLCEKAKPDPVTEFRLIITKEYTSPGGRNSYEDEDVFSFDDIRACYSVAEDNIKQRDTAKYQRSLMTDSLRYDVMKRDGFRCVLCGASPSSDGVKLHVDHILPVSKGGKTEMSNLRTLCDRCNLGKGAKYDPNGLN